MEKANEMGIVYSRRTRTPVKREGAQKLLLLSLVSFASSVIITRTFLMLTGYPQIGNGTLHIAHVLWGGLLLFIASLLPLILANRWVLNTSAIISGVGVGLFIDEVGKFITQNNDYFFPAAAPIIYAFFLITVLVYLEVRRAPVRNPRSELYRVFEEMTEVLDSDLDSKELNVMNQRLESIAKTTDDPNLERLVNSLHLYLEDEKIKLVEPQPSLMQHSLDQVKAWFEHIVNQKRLRWFLIMALTALGLLAFFQFVILLTAIPAPGPVAETLIKPYVAKGLLHIASDAVWLLARAILEGGTGLCLVFSAGMFITGWKERRAVLISILTLTVWLTGINLLIFYIDQFSAISSTLAELVVLITLLYYRNRYLKPTQ